jgi:hypothetical protein
MTTAAMNDRTRLARHAQLASRIQRLTREVERLVPEVEAALASGSSELLAEPSRSLARAAAAVRSAVERRHAVALRGIRAGLEGTSPLMSLLGSRIVLAPASREAPRPPSAGAQALAMLMEEPERTFDAAEIAERLGCSVPVARTTLNRLVKSGHAARAAAGRFRAAPR